MSCTPILEAGPQNNGDKVSLICDVNNYNDHTIYWKYLIGPEGRRYITSYNFNAYPFTEYGIDPENHKVVIGQFQQTYKLVILVIMNVNSCTEAGIGLVCAIYFRF